jgi:hypothetical protein
MAQAFDWLRASTRTFDGEQTVSRIATQQLRNRGLGWITSM